MKLNSSFRFLVKVKIVSLIAFIAAKAFKVIKTWLYAVLQEEAISAQVRAIWYKPVAIPQHYNYRKSEEKERKKKQLQLERKW